MRTHRVGSRWAMVGLSAAWVLGLAIPTTAQEADDAAERKVMERFLSVLEKTPRRGTALDRVYGYHVERGTLDDLVRRYDDRTKADAKDGAAWMLLGLVESQRGRDAAAVAALREAERVRPADPLPPYYLGQALVLIGQPDAAVDAFERALARRPIRADLLEIYQALGRVHQRARRADKALAVWARLEAAFPDDTRVREQIASALSEEDQPAQALARYEKLAKDVKDDYRKVQMSLEAAELKVRLGKAPEALVDFEQLLSKLNPDSWLFKEVRRKIEEVFLRNDDLAGLAKYYEGWIGRTPDDVEAMARLGRTLAHLGRAAESRRWLDQAVKLAPTRRDLRLALIEGLAQEKKFAGASAQYETLARAEPNNPDVIRDWGRLLLRDSSKPPAERRAAAASVWKRLVGDDVKDPVVIAQAADLFRQAEMADDAIALYRRAIGLAPASAQYREYLGEYYHQLKRPADALATWREGVGKTAAELGRLGEVLAGFGYRKEALEPLTEAVKLAPDDFDLRLKLADLLVPLDRPLDALPQLAEAGRVADSDDQREAVLSRQIQAYQAAKRLGEEIAGLKAELDADKDASAARWTRLARYDEAEGKAAEAVVAASRATEVDPKSIAAWATLGRLQEAVGNLAAAAEANRRLAGLDRRNRSEYLSAIARLEARLGRKDEALKAGRELLASAPGNVEHHEAFAELCFNLGEADEGLEALRRASRANPSDPKATNTLADALARQFRTEEAIELYWRAFDRTKDLEGRLGIVTRLTDQYLQRNQFDRLVARLERELREPEKKRELTICLAQAHQSAGDLGAARQELESLLTNNPRDTALLSQLANLAEAEGDNGGAARYLKQVVEISPSPDTAQRLAGFYLRAGEVDEAEAVWSKMASTDGDAARAYSAIDGLLAGEKYDVVLTLTERILLKRPNDWDALYREGFALTNLGRTADAARRFRAILDLRDNDDDPSAIAMARRRGARSGAAATANQTSSSSITMSSWYQSPIYQRITAATSVRATAKLDTMRSVSLASRNTTWSPNDFGQARIAALGFLYAASLKEKDPEAWHKARRAEAEAAGGDVRKLWDWFYLQLVADYFQYRERYNASVPIARALPNDPSAQFIFLSFLRMRNYDRNVTTVSARNAAIDRTPPLPPDQLAMVFNGFEVLIGRKPDMLQAVSIPTTVADEFRRAKKQKEAAEFIRRLIPAANTPDAVSAILGLSIGLGSTDDLIALADRYDRLQSASGKAQASSGMAADSLASMYGQAIGVKAEAKDHAAILRLVDHYLDMAGRPNHVARRRKARSTASMTATNVAYYSIYMASYNLTRQTALRRMSIDFPAPNLYYDAGAIQVLRNAFEVFKRDDLASDLLAHFREREAKAPDDSKLYPSLAQAYLLWWNDDKDEALRQYGRAVALAKDDVELRLSLAELRAQRNEPAEALEFVDSVEPLDHRTMQRRELLALRLSVLAGNVERARKAAERLFGLRIDSQTQVELAAQMNQLGMHDLADAVLARARRRAGGDSTALVALMLQYQRQGKPETAVQVANQVLRQGGGVRQYTTYIDGNDQARVEALQVLARSGKLKELIARAEAQLAASPSSQQALQALIDFYQADNQREKVKETYRRLARLRPDDTKLRFQIGLQLAQNGAAAEAIEHFKFAVPRDPALVVSAYSQIQNAFQIAKKTDELAKLYESVDFKAFNNSPSAVINLTQQLFQDDKSRDQALTIFRKAWKDMPAARVNLIGRIYNDEVWKLPEIYVYAREAILPPENQPLSDPWAGVAQVSSYGTGTVTGLVTRLVEIAARQGKLDPLSSDVESALRKFPGWSGGKALLAVLKARRGQVDEARKDFEALLAGGEPIPGEAGMIIGQEIDMIESLRDVEVKLYERANAEGSDMARQNGFEYGPGRRLALLYKKMGRAGDGRDLVLKAMRAPIDSNSYGYPAGYSAYRRMNESVTYGGLLMELGYAVDAARLYSEVANDTEGLQEASQWNGNDDYYTRQIRAGLERALRPMDRETLRLAFESLLTPRPDARPGEPRLDLVLLCHPRDLDRTAVVCLFEEAIKGLKDHNDLLDEVRTRVERLTEAHPDDLSIRAAAAILAAGEGKADALAPAAGRLAKAVDAAPLEPLASDARPNARQREAASRQILLWVVARECVGQDALRSLGESLAARAREAAGRQADSRWTLAILRESGQSALARGDRPTAEAALRSMLKLVLTNPPAPKDGKPAPTPSAPLVPRRPPAAAPRVAATAKAGASVLTIERFDQAGGLAKLAADHGLIALSLDAVREPLAGGPPVAPIAIGGNMGGARVRSAGVVGQADPIAQRVEDRLFLLEAAWTRAKADPSLVYQTLRSAVLPPGRPNEVFLYARPLALGGLKAPRSVGALLARWAVRAGKADDLKTAIEARSASPLAAGPARVLLAQLAQERGDREASIKALAALRESGPKGAPIVTGEQVCLAALPALDVKETAGAAAQVIASALPRLGGTNADEPMGSLLLRLARHEFEAGKPAEGKKHLLDYLARSQQSGVRSAGDYAVYRRRMFLAKAASEFARAGQLDDALDLLGQYADAPAGVNYGEIPDGRSAVRQVARHLAALPAEERYRKLRAWTMPTADRKSVRSILEIGSESRPPAPFPAPTTADDRGIVATSTLLVEAARATGRLDALAEEARALSDQKVENAPRLLPLIDLARGRAPESKAAIDSRLDDLTKNPPSDRMNARVGRSTGLDPADYLLARDALASADPSIAGAGERLAEKLLGQAQLFQNVWMISHLRRDLAGSLARRAGAPSVASAGDPGLALWTPVGAPTLRSLVDEGPGRERSIWAESAGIVSHVAGPRNAFLMFRAPLSGTFEFSVDAYAGAFAQGLSGYGGLVSEPSDVPYASGVWTTPWGEMVHRPGAFLRNNAFNRMTIRVEPGKVRYSVNGHLFYEDGDPSPTSPWLVLYAAQDRHTAFRNPTLSGRPEIPREVALTHADRLEGWDAATFGDSIKPRRTDGSIDRYGNPTGRPTDPDDYDWLARDGEIRGRRAEPGSTAKVAFDVYGQRREIATPGAVVQSRLTYARPMADGDSISYEFYYEPGDSDVHPSVGRLAYLIEPDGVRLHALTAGAGDEPGQPDPGNVRDAPEGRRGLVALRPGAWNAATVKIEGSTLALALNGTPVYERKLDPDADRTFGLYHDKARTTARVRKVVLRGAWPAELGAGLPAKLFGKDESKGRDDRNARRACAALVGERFLALSAGEVARSARGLPAAERYAKLRAWVLPGDDHESFRLASEFGPTDPPTPPALASPPLDLVAAAKEWGKLDELADAVEGSQATSPLDRRSRLALLAIVRAAQDRPEAAEAALKALRGLAASTITKETPDWQRWPELLAGTGLADRPRLKPAVVAALDEWVDKLRIDESFGPMATQIRHARGVARSSGGAEPRPVARDAGIPGWVRATIGTAETRGEGWPLPLWSYRDGAWHHVPGHAGDLLFLRTPIRGDFEVTCELTFSGHGEARLSYGGAAVGVLFDKKRYEVTQYGRVVSRGAIQPPLDEIREWCPFRLVVKGGTLTAFAAGRKIHEQAVAAEGDPWLALHADRDASASWRNLKISGKPTVPDVLSLSAGSDLGGWVGDSYGEATSGEFAAWQKLGPEIIGRRFSAETRISADPDNGQRIAYPETTAGSKHETVLRYARPIAEDGLLSYEFYHDPGKSLVHPALGRLALLLDHDGVKAHRITDGRFERTGLDPGNLADEPAHRRGPAKLPLKAGAWNRIDLGMKGDTLSLRLNGELVHERPIEPGNPRDFGLFHYADETEARVRDVTYRGDWPRSLPPGLVDRQAATASAR